MDGCRIRDRGISGSIEKIKNTVMQGTDVVGSFLNRIL